MTGEVLGTGGAAALARGGSQIRGAVSGRFLGTLSVRIRRHALPDSFGNSIRRERALSISTP